MQRKKGFSSFVKQIIKERSPTKRGKSAGNSHEFEKYLIGKRLLEEINLPQGKKIQVLNLLAETLAIEAMHNNARNAHSAAVTKARELGVTPETVLEKMHRLNHRTAKELLTKALEDSKGNTIWSDYFKGKLALSEPEKIFPDLFWSLIAVKSWKISQIMGEEKAASWLKALGKTIWIVKPHGE